MTARTLKSLTFGGVVFGLVATAVTTSATPGSEVSYLRFNRAVALPGVELAAGTYLFELALPLSELSLVRVSSRDRKKVYLTAFTDAITRPSALSRDAMVTFGEARAGSAPPITAWFPEGANNGRQFIYR